MLTLTAKETTVHQVLTSSMAGKRLGGLWELHIGGCTSDLLHCGHPNHISGESRRFACLMRISIFGIDQIAVSGAELTDSELSMLAAVVSSMWSIDGGIRSADAHKVKEETHSQVSPCSIISVLDGTVWRFSVLAHSLFSACFFLICALCDAIVELWIHCCMTALLRDAAVSQLFTVISVLAKMSFGLSEWVNLSGTCSCCSGQRLRQTSPLPDCLSVCLWRSHSRCTNARRRSKGSNVVVL